MRGALVRLDAPRATIARGASVSAGARARARRACSPPAALLASTLKFDGSLIVQLAGRRPGAPRWWSNAPARSACARPRSGTKRACALPADAPLADARRRTARGRARDHARSARTAGRSTRASSRSRRASVAALDRALPRDVRAAREPARAAATDGRAARPAAAAAAGRRRGRRRDVGSASRAHSTHVAPADLARGGWRRLESLARWFPDDDLRVFDARPVRARCSCSRRARRECAAHRRPRRDRGRARRARQRRGHLRVLQPPLCLRAGRGARRLRATCRRRASPVSA